MELYGGAGRLRDRGVFECRQIPRQRDASAADGTCDRGLATPTTQLVIPVDGGCAQEGAIKSPGSFNAATITFDNRTRQDLKV